MNLSFLISVIIGLGITYPNYHDSGLYNNDEIKTFELPNNLRFVNESLLDQNPDSVKGLHQKFLIDTMIVDTIPENISSKKNPEEIKNRTANQILQFSESEKFSTWKFNSKYLSNFISKVDTNLWMNHLVYPQQKLYESYTYLGNLGSPSQPDHYFSRENSEVFFFSRFFNAYSERNGELSQYNVKTPLTNLYYSTGGARNEAEQIFKVFHTQNLNKYLNLGLNYNFYGTKGVYEKQETRNNFISIFGNYYKGNVHAQFSIYNKVFINEENGGIEDHSFITDSISDEFRFIPTWLNDAESTTRERSISGIFGYTLVNIKQKDKDTTGNIIDRYIPLITTKILLNQERYSRVFSDLSPDSVYYKYFYVNPFFTRDSVSLLNTEGKVMLEIAQFANFPGMPGIRAWLGFQQLKYYFFKPEDFIYSNEDDKVTTSHLGIAAFSESPYISYNGAMRIYFSGYRADDKEIVGDVRLSPWRNPEMPQLKGQILISETTPDIFISSYFSNHFKWDNHFEKEKKFRLGASLEAKKWELELGYNLIHIRDFIYFNENATPSQTVDVTITSAYLQKNLRIGKGINFFNRIVWQANTNSDVLSIPNIIAFSALFYQRVIVPSALTGQFGVNVTYRSEFYADAYHPAIGQFYKQRIEKVGNYPIVDVFANFKWKRALIYVKYEHANQGYPDNQYFATYLYPMNPRVFKFGVSWTFYD